MRTRIEELFHEVADLSEEARVRHFVDHDVDAKTRKEVEALLAFDVTATSSLEREIGAVAEGALTRIESTTLQCGPYRLVDLLGRGGMGTVHLAERVDGEVTQRVAVKLLRPGADSPGLRQRFLSERQILATLSHSNVARLLDAGHREDGQPYLVMEYVQGKAIDAYASGLGIKAKIVLFLKVCAAVGYLHRNLVVHRDLKPSNILVNEDGEPKLLDFGIAKMLDLNTDATVTGMRMLTPDYASPEQVAGDPVTTATDIYSSGAVLYKLLTGVSPHQFKSESVGAIATAISSGSITSPGKLVPALKGDLEMILMKALRKEAQERYATIEQLSDDLENYLESRPIRARKGDAWYRLRKFLNRYWLPATAATLAVAGLTGGVLVANHQRTIAQRRFVQVRQLSNRLFDIDTEAAKFVGSTKTRQLIVDTSLEYLRRLSTEVNGDPELALEVGNAYLHVARVQGVPISQNLGQLEPAEENLRKAEEFLQSALDLQPGNRTAMLRLAQTTHDQMLLARARSRDADSLRLARKSAEWLEKFNAGKDDRAESIAVLITYLNVAEQFMYRQQYDDALRLCRRATEVAEAMGQKYYPGTYHWVSAEVYRRRGDLDEALNEIRESVQILEPGPGDTQHGKTMNYTLAVIKEGRILGEDNDINLGRPEEAVVFLERAFNLADNLIHQDPSDESPRGYLGMAGISLGNILRHSDASRALTIYDHTLHHLGEIKNNAHLRRYEVSALAGSTYALRTLGRKVEARQRLDAAFERLSQLKDYPADNIKPGSEPDETLSALADYESGNGRIPEAIVIYEKLVGQVLAFGPKPDSNLLDGVDMSRLYGILAALHRRAGHPDLASAMESRRLELWRRWNSKLPHNSFVHRQLSAALQTVLTPAP